MRSLALRLGAMTLLVAACGPAATSAPTSPVPLASPSSAPLASPPSTAAASPSAPAASIVPRPSGTLAWPAEFAVPMTAGTYFTAPPFEVPMTITFAETGWYAGHLNKTFIDLQRYDGVAVGGFPTRMLGFGWPSTVRGAAGAIPVAGLTPSAALDAMADRGSVKTANRAPVELFGLHGERLDFHSDLGNNPIFGSEDGDFGLGPELDMRLVAMPLDNGLLMVAVLAEADDLDEAWAQAAAILETVELRPATAAP